MQIIEGREFENWAFTLISEFCDGSQRIDLEEWYFAFQWLN